MAATAQISVQCEAELNHGRPWELEWGLGSSFESLASHRRKRRRELTRWQTLWPVMVSGDIDKCSAMVEEVFQVKDLFFKLLVIRFTSSRDRLCS
jgi:hypothetical protein